ncbi:hypothetical protein GPL15_23655 [Clostridium sp. MCC353]|uniref:O-antigen ligase family protein n=1 Tax=Clostridium sp. MCC353 TaxID=2592646 RepID=UPI001C0157D8|nr:O-antigen ligase family protein [Clostridium sp. MCC353]MBT9779478.1 hypothetical protein [Clostridium sp. MCC353]
MILRWQIRKRVGWKSPVKIIMKFKIKFNNDAVFSICIAAYYALSVLTRVSLTLFQDSAALKMLLRIGTYIVIIVLLFKMIQKILNIKVFIVLELVVSILFMISNIMGNIGDLEWMSVYKQIAIIYIPLSIAAYNIVDRKILLKSLYFVSLISIPVLSIVAVLSYGNWASSYDMSLGYIMVFSTLVLLADFTIHSRVYNIVLAAFMGLFILFVGSRGPFICILAFVIIELLLSRQYSKVKKTAIISVITILSIVVVINISSILMFVYQTSVKLGFNSRSIYLLMQGGIVSHDSGRRELLEYYWNLINQNPVLGHGVMGNWISDGMYPHNIILEFLLSFGYPMGFVILTAVFSVMLKAVRCDTKYNSAITILFVSYCTHLFVSGSYLKVWQFFVGIALCIPHNARSMKRLKKYSGPDLQVQGVSKVLE